MPGKERPVDPVIDGASDPDAGIDDGGGKEAYLDAASEGAKEAQPKDEDFVDLIVGGYPYRTTRSTLLTSPFHSHGDTYFHALLSGRWKRTRLNEPIEIPDQDGRLFFYILYFLQVGELPRGVGCEAHQSVLSKEDIDKLQAQASFFGLTGLVQLCKVTKDVLKGVEGTGDLDLSPFSDFSVEITHNHTRYAFEFSFSMKYTYKGTTKVHASGDCSDNDQNVRVSGGGVCYANKETFPGTFEIIKRIVENECANKSSAEAVSVSSILKQTQIPREAHLWYAFVINDMIRHYRRYESWDGEFYGGVGFLFSDTTSSFYNNMRTVT